MTETSGRPAVLWSGRVQTLSTKREINELRAWSTWQHW